MSMVVPLFNQVQLVVSQ